MTLASRRERIYSQWPDPITGYELNPEHGQFSVIVPEATTNLITNPSVEFENTYNYATYGGVMASTYAWQAYGACGLQLTPAVSTESGFYYGATVAVSLTAGSTYTASVVIQGEEGKIYYIWFATTAGATLGTKRKWIGTGHKQRIWVTYTETSSTTRRIYVSRDSRYVDQNVFYADGLQLEAKSYPTTYCDGSLPGFVKGEIAYLWTGTPNLSTSTRSAQTRAGGREMNILDLGFHVLAIVGLGMSVLVDQSLPMPGRGELFQGTGTPAREFTLVGSILADTPRHMQAIRDDLIDAFKPDATLTDQPMILRYQACDDEGDPTGDSLDIYCKYLTGLEGNIDNNHQERLALTFKMHLPLVRSTYSGGIFLDFQTTVANANGILMRGTDGIWTDMATGVSGGDTVQAIAIAANGVLYAGGNFTEIGGVANTARIAQWNGTAWAAMGRGAADQAVTCIVEGPDGSIYIGGNFTHVHTAAGADVANTSGIAKWDGAVWSALGTGIDDGILYDLKFDNAGILYATGTFTGMGGVADTDYIAKWDGANWTPLGTGLNDDGFALTLSKDNYIHVGGDFTTANGVSAVRIAKWNGTTFEALSSGLDNICNSLVTGSDGVIYAGGTFHTAGGVTVGHIAKWNGVVWQALGAGTDDSVAWVSIGPDNSLYVSGAFTTAGGLALPDSMAVWNGSIWMPLDVNLPGAAQITAVVFDRTGSMYVGYSTNGAATSATVTASNVGSSTAYPVFYMVGPGTLYQIKNYTTGKSIFFDLTLLAGEGAVLSLDPVNIYFVSSFRGNILSTILPGSNLDFPLLPGPNNISGFFFGNTDVNTKLFMSWINMYWSVDGAVFK